MMASTGTDSGYWNRAVCFGFRRVGLRSWEVRGGGRGERMEMSRSASSFPSHKEEESLYEPGVELEERWRIEEVLLGSS